MLDAKLFPAELTADIPRITLTGSGAVFVEQHKGLMTYQTDDITFRTGAGLLKVSGADMQIALYTAQEAMISGKISRVEFIGSKGRREST